MFFVCFFTLHGSCHRVLKAACLFLGSRQLEKGHYCSLPPGIHSSDINCTVLTEDHAPWPQKRAHHSQYGHMVIRDCVAAANAVQQASRYGGEGDSHALCQRADLSGQSQGLGRNVWRHCHYMWFAHWSRIPDRSRRYGGQGPALSRSRWEVLTKQESGHRKKGEAYFSQGT